MPTALSDPSQALYFVLFLAAVATAVAWYRLRSRRAAIALAVALVLLLALILVDQLVESPREEATRKVQAMADAFSAHDPSRFVEHVSPSFMANGANRDKLKTSDIWRLAKQHSLRGAVWGFERGDATMTGDSEIEIGFYAKGEAGDGKFVLRYIRAAFVREADGQFRMKGMKFYNPADRGIKAEDPIPGFP